MAAPNARIHGDHGLGAAIRQPGRDGLRSEAGEDRHRDRADLGARQERDDGLRHHRQKQPDRVALADAQARECIGQPAGLGVQLGVGEPANDCHPRLPR